METKRTTCNSKTPIVKKTKSKEIVQQQSYAADEELAIALSTTAADDDFEHQQYIMLLRQQEEADAEYARQLDAEFATESNVNHQASIAQSLNPVAGANDTNDIDDVLEEIARMEAQELLKATGHAYNGKTNISRILANEDEEEARIREKIKKQVEINEWRAERDRQDAEYAIMQKLDKQKEHIKSSFASLKTAPEIQHEIEPLQPHLDNKLDNELDVAEIEPEPIPLSNEELRKVRLAFFTANKNGQKF